MADKQSSKTIEFLNALARGERPKTEREEAIDYLVSLENGGDIEAARKQREAMEEKKKNPLMQD